MTFFLIFLSRVYLRTNPYSFANIFGITAPVIVLLAFISPLVALNDRCEAIFATPSMAILNKFGGLQDQAFAFNLMVVGGPRFKYAGRVITKATMVELFIGMLVAILPKLFASATAAAAAAAEAGRNSTVVEELFR